VPECGYGGNMLERDELSVLLKVESPANSVLMTLCEEILLHKPREAPRTNSATQTYTSDAVMSLEQRLNHVDTAYRTKIEGELLKPHQEIEERMLKMKRDLEQRMKAELQAEIAKIREFETQEIRLQEADKHRTKQQEYREELERNYQERLQKLRDRERDIMEKATNKTKELETLNYNYR
jgi:oral-facial-digital syndrome 1 protein